MKQQQIIRVVTGMMLMMIVTASFAFTWRDLWSRRDEQGQYYLNHAKPKKAAKLFTDPMWKAVANYRSGNYESAAEGFAQFDTPMANYNRANSLAHQGQYEEAIDVYGRVLEQDPNNKDASYNRDLLKQLLKRKSQGDVKRTEESEQEKKDNADARESEGDRGNDKTTQSQSRQKSQANKGQSNGGNSKPKDGDQKQAAKNPPSQNGVRSRQDVEREQASKQWLGRIPDDPGGLLKEKFLRDHLRRKQQSQS